MTMTWRERQIRDVLNVDASLPQSAIAWEATVYGAISSALAGAHVLIVCGRMKYARSFLAKTWAYFPREFGTLYVLENRITTSSSGMIVCAALETEHDIHKLRGEEWHFVSLIELREDLAPRDQTS